MWTADNPKSFPQMFNYAVDLVNVFFFIFLGFYFLAGFTQNVMDIFA